MDWVERATKHLNEWAKNHPSIEKWLPIVALFVSVIALLMGWAE